VQRVRQSYRDVQMKLQSNICHGLASRITGLWSTWDVRLWHLYLCTTSYRRVVYHGW